MSYQATTVLEMGVRKAAAESAARQAEELAERVVAHACEEAVSSSAVHDLDAATNIIETPPDWNTIVTEHDAEAFFISIFASGMADGEAEITSQPAPPPEIAPLSAPPPDIAPLSVPPPEIAPPSVPPSELAPPSAPPPEIAPPSALPSGIAPPSAPQSALPSEIALPSASGVGVSTDVIASRPRRARAGEATPAVGVSNGCVKFRARDNVMVRVWWPNEGKWFIGQVDKVMPATIEVYYEDTDDHCPHRLKSWKIELVSAGYAPVVAVTAAPTPVRRPLLQPLQRPLQPPRRELLQLLSKRAAHKHLSQELPLNQHLPEVCRRHPP